MNPFNGFDHAIENEFEDIELDVQLTSDSHIIVIFDEAYASTTASGSSAVVSEMTLEQIQSLDIGDWIDPKSAYRFHALADVLERYKDKLRFHLEIKSEEAEGLASRTCELVREFGATNAVTIQSFWKQWLIESRHSAPEIATAWLVPFGDEAEWDNTIIEEALQEGFTEICPRADLISADLVRTLHKNGFYVRCWDRLPLDMEVFEKVINSGADAHSIHPSMRYISRLRDKQGKILLKSKHSTTPASPPNPLLKRFNKILTVLAVIVVALLVVGFATALFFTGGLGDVG